MKLPIIVLAAGLAAPALAATPVAVPAGTPPFDPACFAGVPWEVDASGPIRVYGCRDAAKVGKADKDGWVTFNRPKAKDGTDAGWIRGRLTKINADGSWTFEVQDNGGGSGTFPYQVTGAPNAKGVLAKKGLKIKALPAT